MNTKDEALKLALEALEKSLPRLAPYGEQDWLDSCKAITAIKQALAAPVQEPSFWVVRHKDQKMVDLFFEKEKADEWVLQFHKGCAWVEPLYTTLPAAQPATEDSSAVAAPVQNAERGEPDHGDELTIAYMSGLHDGKKLAAQKPWVGFTKDDVESWDLPVNPTVFEFAQFIEAKLREKNGGAA
jgi:hypothetical protein